MMITKLTLNHLLLLGEELYPLRSPTPLPDGRCYATATVAFHSEILYIFNRIKNIIGVRSLLLPIANITANCDIELTSKTKTLLDILPTNLKKRRVLVQLTTLDTTHSCQDVIYFHAFKGYRCKVKTDNWRDILVIVELG